ncbi:hypothetical protein MTO96_028401 [Rhipicephalus appendiculatus]
MAIYRVCLDQVVAQRLLASRTLKHAQRTALTGALLLVVCYFFGLFLGVAMTLWFRGCDPMLLGEISSIDQIMPYYINTYLMNVPGFSGLFLAGIAFLMVYNGITAPFVGLCLLAVLFPFVHSKGAGVATLTMVIYQLCHITSIIQSGRRPPRMDMSLDNCPGNQSSIASAINATFFDPHSSLEGQFILFRLSYLWTSFFAIFATLIIGVAVSAATGEMTNKKWQHDLCYDSAVNFWKNIIPPLS